ncbi:hypothetical protein IWX50DRAFT_644965 [Phyllosticta citricarpa]
MPSMPCVYMLRSVLSLLCGLGDAKELLAWAYLSWRPLRGPRNDVAVVLHSSMDLSLLDTHPTSSRPRRKPRHAARIISSVVKGSLCLFKRRTRRLIG